MQHLSTAFLIIALMIVVNDGGATLQNESQTDQLAEEGKNKAVIIVEGTKYVNRPQENLPPNANHTHKPDQRPPSNSPIRTTFDNQKNSFSTPQQYYYYGQRTRVPAQNPYLISPHMLHPIANSVLKFPRVIPLPPGHHYYSSQLRTPLMFAATKGKSFVAKSPKFSLPDQAINGIRSDFVRPPKEFNFTTTTTVTTTTPITTTRVLRTKRIWPKRILEKKNSTALYTSMMLNKTETNTNTNITDNEAFASAHIRVRFVNNANNETKTTTAQPITRGNRRFTRAPEKKKPSLNLDTLKPDDWVPIIPTHYPKHKRRFQTPIRKRSDVFHPDSKTTHTPRKQTLFLHSYGMLPVTESAQSLASGMERKKMIFFKRRRQLKPYLYSAYSSRGLHTPSQHIVANLQTDHSNYPPKFVTKIKHHHHHHHHRYIKTVEKPYKVEVPKPYPIPIKVPHPIPVKVVEKEYVPKPYPIIHHVPVLKQVEVRVPVEKRVPYPVAVTVPVDRPVPVEKKVPYPVPVKVLVPQPYPVERKVPYPIQVKVKEPVEVIKHVPVKVPQLYPVKVPVTVEKKVAYPVEVEKRVPVYVHKPYPVEKKVPYPVRVTVPVDRPVPVEKKVPYPVPVKVLVPQPYPVKVPVTVEKKVPYPVEVEKRVPVYVRKPYPVEKKVPYPVRVPYPIKVPVKVPIEVPVYIHHPMQIFSDDHYFVSGGKNYVSNTARSDEKATIAPQHTVTVHGNTGFTGFQTRSDNPESSTST